MYSMLRNRKALPEFPNLQEAQLILSESNLQIFHRLVLIDLGFMDFNDEQFVES